MRRRARWLVLALALPVGLVVKTLSAEDPAPLPKAAPPAEAPAVEAAKAEQADPARPARDDEYYELYRTFADTMDQVERNYVKDISRRELMEAAIKGVLSKLDPYSNYISPDDLGRFKTAVESQFGGIGIQVSMEDGQLKVLSPLVGSPAYRAGLQAGDRIVEIDGQSTEGIVLDEAVRRLKGDAGSSVSLTIIHRNSDEKLTFKIDREVIQLETVLGDQRKDDDSWNFMFDAERKIGYIRVTAFSRETARDLEKALKSLQSEGLKGLILDLRFNPGGLLTSAIEIADLFVSEGKIVSTAGRNSPERSWDAQQPGTYEGFPMVVLVNRYSASASEIVSACLQDHKRAVIVGERTWGKGSVQNVIELEGGKSALKLTTASYQRPNGHNIHRFPDSKETDEWGVVPDDGYLIKLPDEELGGLIRYRHDRDILLINHYQGTTKPASTTEADAGQQDATNEGAAQETDAKEAVPAETKEPEADAPPATPTTDPASVVDPADSGPVTAVPSFVDRQLQKAVDYLNTELAKVADAPSDP